MKKLTRIVLSMAAVTLACSAFAQKQGDNIFSLGVAYMSPDTTLGTLSNPNSAAALGLPGTIGNYLAGATAKVGAKSTLTLGWLHMYTDNWGAEMTLGIPPRVSQDLSAPLLGAPHPGAAKIDVWTPAIVGKYFFGQSQDVWRPYLGLGASYVSFHNISLSSDTTVQLLGGNGAKLSSSWTPVYNLGLVYNIDQKWSINGSVSYLPVRTNATFFGTSTLGGPIGTTTGEVKLNTTDYVIRVGYKF